MTNLSRWERYLLNFIYLLAKFDDVKVFSTLLMKIFLIGTCKHVFKSSKIESYFLGAYTSSNIILIIVLIWYLIKVLLSAENILLANVPLDNV